MRNESLVVRSTALLGYTELIDSLGGNSEPMFNMVNLPIDYTHIDFIDCHSVARLGEIASIELNEPNFGLKLADQNSNSWPASGPGISILVKSVSIDAFFKAMIKYSQIHTNAATYEYHDRPDIDEVQCHFHLHPCIGIHRQTIEYIAASMVKSGRSNIENLYLKHVSFQHSKPKDISLHEKLFACPIEFNAERNVLVADRNCLAVKSNLFQKSASLALKQMVNHLLVKAPRNPSTVTSDVMAIIPGLLGVGECNARTVANHLEVSEKKLQRLLKEENSNFSIILDDTRKYIAQNLLSKSDITIFRIAKILDYSSEKPFITAAKRWFNMTPGAYRMFIRADH